MANTLTSVIPTIFSQGLMALREYCVMPRLVNSSYSTDAREKGDTVDIPIPSAIAVTDVTPGAYSTTPGAITPTKASIQLQYWREAAFVMTDKDLSIAVSGVVPMQVTEAIRAIANDVNSKIMALYKKFYGYTGTAGTTPFGSDTSAATQARRLLGEQLAPLNPRHMILDPTAEANALGLRAFQDASFRADAAGIIEGQIGRKLGFNFFVDQQIPTHTAGTITTGLIAKAATAQAVGDKTIVCTTAASTGACALLEGDIVTFAGHDQTYVLTAAATQASAATDVTLNIEPGLVTALAGSEDVTVKGTHVANLAIHRDAIGFASRLLIDVVNDQDRQNMMAVADPVSGLALRLEVKREHKQTRWSFDVLYGTDIVRREYGVRVAG